MASADQILARIIDAIRLQDQSMSMAVGSPEYRFAEAVAVEIESVSYDGTLMDYHWDIDSKSGVELDYFVSMFGMIRFGAQSATALVTFSRGTPADQDYSIPSGTQVFVPATGSTPAVFFITLTPGSLLTGETAITLPVQAVQAGASGDVAAGAIIAIAQQLGAATQVVNNDPASGGVDAESDADLRARWRRTVFKNLAGTEAMFLGLCFEESIVRHAKVIGPVERFDEQVEVTSSAVTSSMASDESKFSYPSGGESLGTDVGLDDEVLGLRGLDYALDASAVPPIFNLTVAGQAKFPVNTVLDLEHEYCPASSRNDPLGHITNKVDVFVDGADVRPATEELPFLPSPDWTFGGTLDVTQWLRDDGVTNPDSGNYLTPLFKVPVVSVPTSIQAPTGVYQLGIHYFFVRDISLVAGSVRARDGIEWVAGSGPGDVTEHPQEGQIISLQYEYDALIERLDEAVQQMSLVTTDTLVHEPRWVNLRFNLGIVLAAGFAASTVEGNVQNALATWLASKDFLSDVQVADVIETVGAASGVDNVRLIRSGDERDEVDLITIGGTGMSGEYHLSIPDGHGGVETTDIVAWNEIGAGVQALLEQLPSVQPGDVVVTRSGFGNAGDPYVYSLAWSGPRFGSTTTNLTADFTGVQASGGDLVAALTQSVRGIGHGIQVIGDDGYTQISTSDTDIYLTSNQLTRLSAGIGAQFDVLARNTF